MSIQLYGDVMNQKNGARHKGAEEFLVLPIAAPLINWYQNNARSLPWREETDAYRIWVSEIMLQQTRVEAVKPYYARFLLALPDVVALSRVEDDVLYKLWEGLGYYSRARNLKRAAIRVVEEHGGKLPQGYEVLLKLPGIGPYTAGAIASIAYSIPVPAVDGNVLRVLARLSDCTLDIAQPKTRRLAEQTVEKMLPKGDPGTFNQALMELGACVCLPNGEPKCGVCPLNHICRGYASGRAAELPVKEKKAPRKKEEYTVFVLRQDGCFAVRRRMGTGLLAGLWEFPNCPGNMEDSALGAQLSLWGAVPTGEMKRYTKRHIFTHVEWEMRVYALPVDIPVLPEGWEWAREESDHALPAAFRICLTS